MLGTWTFSNLNGNGNGTPGHQGTLTFLPNGSYVHLERGPNEGHGYSGLEVGTYSFTPETATGGTLAFHTLLDTNGDWGANSESFTVDVTTTGAGKCFGSEGTQICSPLAGSPSLMTGWYRGVGYGDISVIAFLPDGHYLHGVDPAIGVLEAGTYTWDAASGALTLGNVQRFGSGDEVTLSQMGVSAMALQSGTLVLQTATGAVSFAATPTSPVPEPAIAMLFTAGAFALACAGRKRNGAMPLRPPCDGESAA